MVLSDPEQSCCSEAMKSRLMSGPFWLIPCSRVLNVEHRALPIVCAPTKGIIVEFLSKQSLSTFIDYDIIKNK